MKKQRSGVARTIWLFVLIFVVLRFFPLIMGLLVRLGQMAASGLRGYGWVIIPALFIGIGIWKFKKQSAAQRVEVSAEGRPMRDVTNTASPD